MVLKSLERAIAKGCALDAATRQMVKHTGCKETIE